MSDQSTQKKAENSARVDARGSSLGGLLVDGAASDSVGAWSEMAHVPSTPTPRSYPVRPSIGTSASIVGQPRDYIVRDYNTLEEKRRELEQLQADVNNTLHRLHRVQVHHLICLKINYRILFWIVILSMTVANCVFFFSLPSVCCIIIATYFVLGSIKGIRYEILSDCC
jgi:hypothetical protein